MTNRTNENASRERAGVTVEGGQAETAGQSRFSTNHSANAVAVIDAAALSGLVIHPIAEIFPAMADAEFAALKQDIAEHGQHEPIWLADGQVIDGRHRLRACLELGIDAQARTYDGTNPVGFIISLNLHRRHLSESQRGMVAARLATMPVGANQHAQICAPSQTEAAELLNVSRRTVQSAARVSHFGAPELVEAVEQGEVSVSAAAAVAALPADEQAVIVEAGPESVRQAASTVRKEKAAERVTVSQDELTELREQVAELRVELKETLADNEMMGRVFDADDKLQAAMDEAKRQKAVADSAERTLAAKMGEMQGQARQINYWMRRAEKAEKDLAAALALQEGAA